MVVGVADTHEGGSGASLLHGALAEGGGIGEFLVVEDVVEVEAANADLDAAEVHVAEHGGIVFLAFVSAFDAIAALVVAREDVDADERAVDAEVEFVLQVALQCADVYLVAEEYPSPSEVGTHLDARLRGEGESLSAIASQRVAFIVVGALHHEDIVVFKVADT